MGTISIYLANALLDHVFNHSIYNSPATVYLGLSTSDPHNNGSGISEPSNGYSRQPITFEAAENRRITQDGEVQFPVATADWGVITHWFLSDAATGGNMLAYGSLSSSRTISAGNVAIILSGQIYVEFNTGYISDYLSNRLLDFVFRNQSYTPPSTYIVLTTATINDNDTGATITEPSGNGYSRALVAPNSDTTASVIWNVVSSGAINNADDITIGPASGGSWGTVVATAVVDNSTAGSGNVLFYDNDMSDQEVEDGDICIFSSEDFNISLIVIF